MFYSYMIEPVDGYFYIIGKSPIQYDINWNPPPFYIFHLDLPYRRTVNLNLSIDIVYAQKLLFQPPQI